MFKYVWLFSGYQVLNMKAKFSVIFSWKYGKYSKSNEKIPSKLCFCISLVKLSTIFTNTTEISLSNNISATLWNAWGMICGSLLWRKIIMNWFSKVYFHKVSLNFWWWLLLTNNKLDQKNEPRLFHDGNVYHIEISPFIFSENP